MQTQNQQESQLLLGFRTMTQEEKDELVRFVISGIVHQQMRARPQLRVINGKNDS